MAYAQLRQAIEPVAESDAIRESDSPARESGSAEPQGLGPDEWAVVDIARKDGLWSLNPDGLPQRLVRAVFGIRPPLPFANERLEALRRFVVVAWNRRSVGARNLRQFLASGFSSADARQVLGYLSRQRQIQSWPRGLA